MKTITTPWGKATELEQVSVAQRSGERRFSTIVQLLETAEGERLVRFAYTTDGSARRGPVTLRVKDVERMQKLLERAPELREALGMPYAQGAAMRRRFSQSRTAVPRVRRHPGPALARGVPRGAGHA